MPLAFVEEEELQSVRDKITEQMRNYFPEDLCKSVSGAFWQSGHSFPETIPALFKKEKFSELYQVQTEVINSERNDIMQQHDKIINMAAKKVLAPQGLFRQGTSRTWLDDNGYFMIFVVFDSSNWSKGSYLGVGIDFFWEKSESLNDIFSYSYGEREKEFCKYSGNDDEFQTKMEEFAEVGLRKVIEYRKFKDMDYAKKCLEQKVSNIPENRRFWEVYDLAMICFLMGDFENGINFFENYLEILQGNFYAGEVFIEWHETFYKHCIHHIKPYLTSKEAAQKMVLDMIQRRRNYFNSKPSFKKMRKEIFLLY